MEEKERIKKKLPENGKKMKKKKEREEEWSGTVCFDTCAQTFKYQVYWEK